MKKIYLSFIILFATAGFAFAQYNSVSITLPNIIPPSPDAAALGKYGDIQVDKATGVPQISVPVYTIKTPRFTLPISLSYDASGIKVDQMASWVGLGWSLNAGGVIARTIVGQPDESGNGILNNPLPTNLSTLQYPAAYTELDQLVLGSRDFDPDYFFFNFNSHTGKFIFGQDNNPLLISNSAIKVQFLSATSTFNITDEKGDLYIFNDKETVSNSVESSIYPKTTFGTTSWYLSQMISADKSDTIRFSYVPELSGLEEISYDFSQALGPMSSLNPSAPCNDLSHLDPVAMTETERITTVLRISSITFNGGKINFVSQGGRLDEPTVTSLNDIQIYSYDYANKVFNQIKDCKLNTGYFHSTLQNVYNPQLTNLQYRLRLDAVVESDKNGAAVQTYSFDYNNLQPPPVNNFAQDIWGYYNGITNNTTLLQTQSVVDPGTGIPQTLGQANRNTDPVSMQAGMLTAIHYPTKGYTQFTYEPHQYVYSSQSLTNVSEMASAVGVTQESSTVTFTPVNSPVNISISVNISNYNNFSPPVLVPPLVKLINVTTGAVLYLSEGNPQTPTSQTYSMGNDFLVSGQQYQLVATAAGNQLVHAQIAVNYQYYTSTPTILTGGGLRVVSVNNYDPNGNLLTTDAYKYASGETGIGETISPVFALVPNIIIKGYSEGRSDPSNGVFCSQCLSQRALYNSSSAYALSTLDGSPIAYDAITQYHGTPTTNLGKTIFEYDLWGDSSFPVLPFYQNGVMITPNSWRNGQERRQAAYQYTGGQYLLEHEKLTSFFINQGLQGQGMKIGYTSIFTGCTNQNPYNYYYFTYPIYTGAKLPAQVTDNDYDPAGQTIINQKVTNYYYDNLAHLQPTRVVTTSSKGDTLQQTLVYPQDMVNNGNDPTGIYASMSAANMLDPVIESINFKNGAQLTQTKTNYYNFNNVIKPNTVEFKKGTNPSEIRLNYQNYDARGNLLAVAQQSGPPMAYQWGYNKSLPVAKVSNAKSNDIFYDGFEEGDGISASGDAKTGHYSFTGTFQKNLTGLDAGNYTLSYWSKINGAWSWVVIYNNVPVSGNFNISLPAGQVDDVRFYPALAQMTTYTYDSLIGMTSSTDGKGEITYYEYDAFQRLMNVRDKDGNIIKHLDYHYQGQ